MLLKKFGVSERALRILHSNYISWTFITTTNKLSISWLHARTKVCHLLNSLYCYWAAFTRYFWTQVKTISWVIFLGREHFHGLKESHYHMNEARQRAESTRAIENWNQKRKWSQKNIHFGAVTSNFHSIYWVTRNNFYGYFVFKGRTKRTKHINDSKTPKINSEVEQTRDNDFFLLFFPLDSVFTALSLRMDCIPYCVSSTNNQKRKMKIIIFGHTNQKCRIFVGCLCRRSVSVAFLFSYFFCLPHFISFYSQRWPY